MTIFKKIFKLTFASPAILLLMVMVSAFIFITSSNAVPKNNSVYSVAIKSNVEAKEFKEYAQKTFDVKNVTEYEYALNTMYIDAYIEIKDNYQNVTIHTKSRRNESLIQKLVDQFLNAYEKNDFSLLTKKVPIEIVKTPAAKTPPYLTMLGYMVFLLGGQLVTAILVKILKKDVLSRVTISPISIKNLVIQIGLGLAFIQIVLLVIVHGVAATQFTSSFKDQIYYFMLTFIVLNISIALATIVYIYTQNSQAVELTSVGIGMLLFMVSGGMIPIDLLPKFVGSISKISPLYYFYQLVEQFNYFNFSILICMMLVAYLLLGIVIKVKRIDE